jgi:hypothetical protein
MRVKILKLEIFAKNRAVRSWTSREKDFDVFSILK